LHFHEIIQIQQLTVLKLLESTSETWCVFFRWKTSSK